MYVTTFYSFKGGVGRTMALVNSAVSLAMAGRRVLVVDFDIEAPGLDTFDVFSAQEEKPGIVDFVSTYLDSGQAPDAAEYLSECKDIGTDNGKLWLMRSGWTESYAANFQRVDWGQLYEQCDGFLLFEDLKAQWRELLNPDYVLIDSRTGHTDSSGICTRQLPNAVVVLFFPNQQNLRGIIDVVAGIRAEAEGPRKKAIHLHFVMSNVPDLDDEDRIFAAKIRSFKDQLGLRRNPMIVHRYDSLSLLNQSVFVKDRPASRLSKEYDTIIREIRMHNSEDRDGAMEYIQRAQSPRRFGKEMSLIEQSNMLDRIERDHAQDGEVIFALSELKRSLGDDESASGLLTRSLEIGYAEPRVLLRYSEMLEDQGDTERARYEAARVLDFKNIPAPLARSAISRLFRMEGVKNATIIDTPAVASLDESDKLWIADSLGNLDIASSFRVSLYEQIINSMDLSENWREQSKNQLGLLYIKLRRFEEAGKLFREEGKSLEEMSIADMFNFAMAKWGESNAIPVDIFERVVKLDRAETPQDPGPNYLQCMAMAYGAIGDKTTALDYMKKAHESIHTFLRQSEFSCWCYQLVDMEAFFHDLCQMEAWIENNDSRGQYPVRSNMAGSQGSGVIFGGYAPPSVGV